MEDSFWRLAWGMNRAGFWSGKGDGAAIRTDQGPGDPVQRPY